MCKYGCPPSGDALCTRQHALDIEVDRLVAVGFEAPRQVLKVSRPFVPVQCCCLENDGGKDRVQARSDRKEIGTVERKSFDVGRVLRVEAAGDAGHDRSEEHTSDSSHV